MDILDLMNDSILLLSQHILELSGLQSLHLWLLSMCETIHTHKARNMCLLNK